MKIHDVAVKTIKANPWNPNKMSQSNFLKLKREIEENGFKAPILVRPRGGLMEVVDGEHRFEIAKELGLKKVPCVIEKMKDTEAKVKTLQLNGLRGENDPEKLVALLADIKSDIGTKALASLVNYSAVDIESLLSIKDFPKGGIFSDYKNIPPPELNAGDLELYAVVMTHKQRMFIEERIKSYSDFERVEDQGEALYRLVKSTVIDAS